MEQASPSGNPAASDANHVNGFSMKVQLLPLIEQASIFNSVNFQFTGRAPEQFTVATVKLWAFNCPSDTNEPGSTMTVGGQSARVAGSSYPNNIGTFLGNHGGTLDGPSFVYPADGVALGEPLTNSKITDGLSRTILFAETLKGANRPGSSGPRLTYAMAKVGYQGPDKAIDLGAAVADCQASTAIYQQPAGTDWDRKGEWWMVGECGLGGGYSHINTPNTRACFFKGAGPAPHYTMIGASSNHGGGVNVAFLDASVKFLTDAIDPAVWRALATRAGGETIASESY